MESPRSEMIRSLRELIEVLKNMSDKDFDRMRNENFPMRPPIFRSTTKLRRARGKGLTAVIPEEKLQSVEDQLKTVSSREEGQQIVERAFKNKEELFAFAKYLDLPAQRKDRAEKILDRIVTGTVGRRLGGKAVRGRFGTEQQSHE